MPVLAFLACADSAAPGLPVPLQRAEPLYPDGATEVARAPHQIDTSVDVRPGEVAVDFGTADPALEAGAHDFMTIVGAAGASAAKLDRLTESCVELCGPGAPPVCHYAGIYTLGDPERAGQPLAALPGRVEVARTRSPEVAPGPVPPPAERWLSDEYQPAPEVLGDQWVVLEDFGYRWVRADGQVRLESNGAGESTTSSIDLASCRQSELGDLTQLACDGAAFLYRGPRLLVASFGAEVPAAAELLETFRAQDIDYALVVVGLRTRRAVGLLFRDGDTWRIALRPPDYPAVC